MDWRPAVHRTVLLVAALSAGWPARADEDAVAKYRNFLPQQLMDLPEEARSSDVPIMYIQAAGLAMSPFADLVFQAQLNTLMYSGIGDLDGAKKAFQSDLGADPTGNLTVWQIHQLEYRSERTKLGYVGFFSLGNRSALYDTFAIVQGTLTILDESIYYPINNVKIKCDKGRSICEYQQVALMIPDENDWSQTYSVVEVADEKYRITRWEGDQIDAIPVEATGCRINQLALNFSTKEFYEIARNNKENCDLTLGGALPPLEKPRVSQIVDGSDIISAEFQKVHDEVFSYMESGFQARVNKLREEANAKATAEADPPK